jgi:hypothetical protein
MPWISSGCSLSASGRDCGAGSAVSDGMSPVDCLLCGAPIGSTSEYSSTDRSTTHFLAHVDSDPTPSMLQTSSGNASSCFHVCRLCCRNVGARSSFRSRRRKAARARAKWLKTSYLELNVAIYRQFPIGCFRPPARRTRAANCHAVDAPVLEFAAPDVLLAAKQPQAHAPWGRLVRSAGVQELFRFPAARALPWGGNPAMQARLLRCRVSASAVGGAQR